MMKYISLFIFLFIDTYFPRYKHYKQLQKDKQLIISKIIKLRYRRKALQRHYNCIFCSVFLYYLINVVFCSAL